MEQRTITRDTRIAAALGTLGIPIQIFKSLDAASGRQVYHFSLALRSACGRHDTRSLKRSIGSGSLEDRFPAHEALTCLRAMQNRTRVLDFQNQGKLIRLAPVPRTRLFQYLPGDTGLPGTGGQKEILETRDLKMVCALAIVGVPLLSIAGAHGDFTYTLPRHGLRHPESPQEHPADALVLMPAWRASRETMPEDCPFSQAMWGLVNRERLTNALHAEIQSIILRKPRSMKSAIVREDAADAAFDRVKEHFDQ